ncbi:nucleoside-diphosphate-sugar epimerase [Penicillium brevicompactum]|uniref:nucleoside-diphosphate-sugar epimerase n=1 Tax=Penicillium brevicompactum TaxID=5074 RepID=UPI00254244A1|nr:nucleoside-diphosphate-sugar epimerase [Penicillium brevicompactum]KAJ5333869.1 nucleoside-diphosphate-sugar epimerase [Penicillium brevicompactum]
MQTVFITGASGYIGGDILAGLVAKHPDHTYRLLVRSEQSQKQISAAYPSAIIVPGGLDDFELIRRESSNADIIIHTAEAADHLPAAQAIAKGAIEGHSPDKPVYWLHTSGAGIFSSFDDEDKTYGQRSEVVWDDVKDIQKIVSFPDHAMHRDVDKTVFNSGASAADILKVAIISPTTVYGRGRGPCSQRSRQIYEMAKFILAQNKIPKIGTGEAIGSNVHVHSVTALFIRLFESALQRRDEELLWGSEAYYLAEEGEHCWGEVADTIAEVALKKGFLQSTPTKVFLDRVSAFKLAGFEATSWGNNMRCRASRARSLLQWQPVGKALEEELSQIVDGEYNDLKRGS